ncbi:hypothetical protein OAH78_02825 [Gammaproteobacteria bacterium]|nr:hypothetical protein [Gammaproteobacteria bacterium]
MDIKNQKEKILIVLSNDIYIRNYIKTSALLSLEKDFDCHFIANCDITIRQELENKPNFHGYYQVSELMKIRHQKIFDTLMYRFRFKSSSFAFRILRQTPNFRAVLSYGPKNRAHLRLLKWMVMKPYLIIQRLLLSVDVVYDCYLNFLKKFIEPNKELRNYIHQNDYGLVIFPSSAYDVDGIDVVTICNARNMKSLFLVDNWDNLSSKSILWQKPSHICVWGEQSRNHAVDIQGFDPTRVSLLGTPRFDKYFEQRNQDIASHFNFRYILFVGTALNFNEERALTVIDEILEKNKESWGHLKLIYRPHPWRQNHIAVKESYGKNIITDPQILLANNDKSTKHQPNLDYYAGLLHNAEFLVGGLTTMLIEGLIFHKQFLAIAHDDKKLISNMRNAWDYFEHFKGLDSVASLKFSFNENDMEATMIDCWTQRESIDKSQIDKDRQWYLYHDENKYKDRLVKCVNKIL